MGFLRGLRGKRLALATVAIFGAAGGIAFASIPDDGTGVYHACLAKNGKIRIIDPVTDQCKKNETEITFNQKGPQGIPGVPGQNGTNGVSPTVTQLPPGNTNCPAGGAAITDAANSTAYVCSGRNGADGQPFSGTFTSPNGQYSIAVTDAGVTITGAGNTVGVSSTGVRVDTHGGGSVTVMSDTNLTLRAGGGGTLESSSPLTVRGSTVNINAGGSCLQAARTGDFVHGTATSAGDVSASIIGGSSSVCVGAADDRGADVAC